MAKQPKPRRAARPRKPRRTGGPPPRPRAKGPKSAARQIVAAPAGVQLPSTNKRDEELNRSMPEFFAEVARGLVEAQYQLDEASAKYLDAALRQEHVLPSVFRIPKLSAQLSFSLEHEKSGATRLVIYNTTEKARTLQQQSVSFDILAVPPSPELTNRPFFAHFVFDKPERAFVLQGVGDPIPIPDAVLVLNLFPAHYLVALTAAAEGTVGVWHVLRQNAGVAGAPVRRVAPADPRLGPLWQTLNRLGDIQRNFLKDRPS